MKKIRTVLFSCFLLAACNNGNNSGEYAPVNGTSVNDSVSQPDTASSEAPGLQNKMYDTGAARTDSSAGGRGQ